MESYGFARVHVQCFCDHFLVLSRPCHEAGLGSDYETGGHKGPVTCVESSQDLDFLVSGGMLPFMWLRGQGIRYQIDSRNLGSNPVPRISESSDSWNSLCPKRATW